MILAELLYNHFSMISSRLKTFAGIIKALILCRGSNYKNLAEEIDGDILLESKIKAVSRFLAGNDIDIDCYYEFMQDYIPQGKVLLSLDRTIWGLGKEIRNILVLSVSYDKIAMPVLFKLIPYKGSCTADDQIEVIEKFIEKYGLQKIGAITADREFDNEKILKYLHSKDINYAIRLRRTNRVIDENGEKVRLEKIGERTLKDFDTEWYSVPVKLDHIKIESGDYLSVVSNRNSACGLTLYRHRWDIESAFKACKTSGFRMEDIHIKSKIRLENFIKCLFIAYAIAIKVGHIENTRQPIKMKKTLGCKMRSIFQHGIFTIKQAYSRSQQLFRKLILDYLLYNIFNST